MKCVRLKPCYNWIPYELRERRWIINQVPLGAPVTPSFIHKGCAARVGQGTILILIGFTLASSKRSQITTAARLALIY